MAYYVKGLCGFANTLVFNSILGFGVNNVNISPVELVLGFPSNLIMTIKNGKKLDLKNIILLSILVVLGSLPGAFILKFIDAKLIKVFFGFVVILLGIEMWIRDNSQKKAKESRIAMLIIGIMSGILCGMFGVGALLVAYIGRVTDSTVEFKANISAVFIVENLFRIITYSVMGIITIGTLKQSIVLMPFMIIGLAAGIISSNYINERSAKKLVIILLILSGIALVIKNM